MHKLSNTKGNDILSLYKSNIERCVTNKTILITGGTGSFGQKFVYILLEHFKPKAVIIFSRDEFKQHNMQTVLGYNEKKYPNLHYVIGDIRNQQRIYDTLKQYRVNIVIHTAAIKHVDICEKNPTECIDINIIGTINLVNACKEAGVEKVLALSTDKCVDPINIYGASKLCLERIVTSANNFYILKENSNINNFIDNTPPDPLFSVVRYGNVLGSRGSVIHVFSEQIKNGEIKITDENMTRFTIMKEEAVNFAMNCLSMMIGGEIFVPELPTYKIGQLVNVMKPNPKFLVTVIGIRPGEKTHECMISKHESHLTFHVDCVKHLRSDTSYNDHGSFYVIRNHYYGDYLDYKSNYSDIFGCKDCITDCAPGWSYMSDSSTVISDQKLKGLIAQCLWDY